MAPLKKFAVTKKETARMIGLKDSSLPLVEARASIRPDRRRKGYTSSELRRLLSAVRKALTSAAKKK